MFSKELEEIIDAALADGVLTDKERSVLHKRAQAEGVDADELDIVIDGRLAKMKKAEDWLRPTPPTQLENEKLGNVVKCPSCGAPVVGGSAVCPECGYTFSNVKSNSSVEKLAMKLEEFNRRQEDKPEKNSVIGQFVTGSVQRNLIATSKRKMDIISSFPIPNTRADLLEFLTMAQAKANAVGSRTGNNMAGDEEDLSYGYWLLYTNCINKAKVSFSKDADFAPYFEHYEKEFNKTKGIIGFFRTRPPKTKFLIIYLLGLGLLILFVASLCLNH